MRLFKKLKTVKPTSSSKLIFCMLLLLSINFNMNVDPFSYIKCLLPELMVLGFISLILTFGQSYISNICIPEKVADTMLYCAKRVDSTHHKPHPMQQQSGGEAGHRRLLLYDRRFLGGASKASGCKPVSASFLLFITTILVSHFYDIIQLQT